MKTFKQTVTESRVGDELYEIKLKIGDWWKKNSANPRFKSEKKELEKHFNTALRAIDSAVDLVYEKDSV